MERSIDGIIFSFLQAAFWDELPADVEPDCELALIQLRAHQTLAVSELSAWQDSAREGLKVLLKTWLLVLRIASDAGEPVRAPIWVLDGSASNRLGEPLLDMFLERFAGLEELYLGGQAFHDG